MSKKPAPLTSDLLVRKGDATPSSIDPQDRATAPDAPSAPESTSEQHPSEEATAPVMPEPDIVIAADESEEDTTGSRRRLAAVLALVAVVTAGVLAVSMFETETTTSVAPLSDDTNTAEAEAPSVAPIIAPPGPQSDGAPVPPEAAELRLAPVEATPEAAVVDETPAPEPAPEETAVVEAPVPAAPPREAATITPPASDPEPVKPETVADATPPAAPVAAIAEPGQYLIQLLSVRSESAAKTAWANLQTAHSDLLGGETLNIEAADLGERGTFYRVRFGAFDGKADATAVCTALKAQGQDCLVKRAQ